MKPGQTLNVVASGVGKSIFWSERVNERIRELAVEAGYQEDMFGRGHWDMPECKKFAELIVRECCGAADEWYQKHNELHWDPAQHIRNHFGVEE